MPDLNTMPIRLAAATPFLYDVVTDGPGVRTSVYFQGCGLACPGCQSQHLWPANGGTEHTVASVARTLLAQPNPITIIGGEPFDQPFALAWLVWEIKRVDPERHIIIYSGYTYEQIREFGRTRMEHYAMVLAFADVLVDGPFRYSADDPLVQWRGSRNQRPIDLAAMRAAGDWNTLILLPWDRRQTITITTGGQMTATEGMAAMLRKGGNFTTEPTRRCGQTTRLASATKEHTP